MYDELKRLTQEMRNGRSNRIEQDLENKGKSDDDMLNQKQWSETQVLTLMGVTRLLLDVSTSHVTFFRPGGGVHPQPNPNIKILNRYFRNDFHSAPWQHVRPLNSALAPLEF